MWPDQSMKRPVMCSATKHTHELQPACCMPAGGGDAAKVAQYVPEPSLARSPASSRPLLAKSRLPDTTKAHTGCGKPRQKLTPAAASRPHRCPSHIVTEILLLNGRAPGGPICARAVSLKCWVDAMSNLPSEKAASPQSQDTPRRGVAHPKVSVTQSGHEGQKLGQASAVTTCLTMVANYARSDAGDE